MGAPCRKMDPKVATAPKTQSALTIKVEIKIKIKFNSRIKTVKLNIIKPESFTQFKFFSEDRWLLG